MVCEIRVSETHSRKENTSHHLCSQHLLRSLDRPGGMRTARIKRSNRKALKTKTCGPTRVRPRSAGPGECIGVLIGVDSIEPPQIVQNSCRRSNSRRCQPAIGSCDSMCFSSTAFSWLARPHSEVRSTLACWMMDGTVSTVAKI